MRGIATRTRHGSSADTTGIADTAYTLRATGHMHPAIIVMYRLIAGITTDMTDMTAVATGTTDPGETGTADGTDARQTIRVS